MKILIFGSCNIDYVYDVTSFVKPGETISSINRKIFPGGKGLNQAIAVARSGSPVYFAGCIGKDGVFLKDLLESSGVNTELIKIKENVPTGHAVIQVDERGENSIILFAGANHCIDRWYIDEVLEKFEAEDIIMLQNEINCLEYIVERAHEKGMQIVFNPSPFDTVSKGIDLNKISLLILNEVEAEASSGYTEPEAALNYFGKTYRELRVVLTLGAKGSIYFDKNSEIFCPAFLVNAIDTTSAGDTFTGYFISGMKAGYPIKRILKTASAASALAVSKNGASSSIPYEDEVKASLAWLMPNTSKDHNILNLKKTVLKYIEEHPKDVTLNDISNILGYSRTYIATWIKTHIGMSFSALLKQCRCKMASRLLIETDLSIHTVSEECGYENESFFRKIFYEEFGKTPSEYRKFYNVK